MLLSLYFRTCWNAVDSIRLNRPRITTRLGLEFESVRQHTLMYTHTLRNSIERSTHRVHVLHANALRGLQTVKLACSDCRGQAERFSAFIPQIFSRKYNLPIVALTNQDACFKVLHHGPIVVISINPYFNRLDILAVSRSPTSGWASQVHKISYSDLSLQSVDLCVRSSSKIEIKEIKNFEAMVGSKK